MNCSEVRWRDVVGLNKNCLLDLVISSHNFDRELGLGDLGPGLSSIN